MEIIDKPRIFLIGESVINNDELQCYLDYIGASEWDSDALSDAEKIIEVMGRICYRSFKPGLNPNVKKIREGNKKYISNIIQSGHGSVLEHTMVNFILADVSRVFTHELVRHRIGVAISQESLRFVRLNKLRFWIPSCFKNYPDSEKREKIINLIVNTVEYLEKVQLQMAEILELDKKDFKTKKKYTSAMRRVAPIGLATTIGWSVNLRALRYIIEQRTAPWAEEEIRLVFGLIMEKVRVKYPNIFGDYHVEVVDGLPWYKTDNSKV